MIALERRFPYEPQPFLRREFWTDLLWFSTLFSVLMGFLAARFVIPGIDHLTGWSQTRGIREWPLVLQILVSLLAHDLFIYLFHRWMHVNPYLWRIHEAHHSTPDVDWVGGSRGHVIENMITGTAELAPIVLFMSPEVAAIKSVIDACWGMWIHSNIDWDMGPLKWVINGPYLHRWHHAREVHDVNFATKFSFWDYLLGTAYLPDRKPESYGLDVNWPQNIAVQQAFAFRKFRPKAVLRPRGPREAARLHAGDPQFVVPAEEYRQRMEATTTARPLEPGIRCAKPCRAPGSAGKAPNRTSSRRSNHPPSARGRYGNARTRRTTGTRPWASSLAGNGRKPGTSRSFRAERAPPAET
jgi:sterol desaturase/sphingolipid hydroxylase (fatty acid hydroxylase superfamily)